MELLKDTYSQWKRSFQYKNFLNYADSVRRNVKPALSIANIRQVWIGAVLHVMIVQVYACRLQVVQAMMMASYKIALMHASPVLLTAKPIPEHTFSPVLNFANAALKQVRILNIHILIFTMMVHL